MIKEKTKDEQAAAELQETLAPLFTVSKVTSVNWKVDGSPGHPFTIGPAHVAYAHDHCGGRLGDDVLEKIPCKARQPGKTCNSPLSAHTSETVAFLFLKRNATNKEVGAILVKAKPICERHGVDGFAFVKNQFTITEQL